MTVDSQLFDQLKAQVKVVAEAREKVSALKQRKAELLDEWNRTNQELLDALTQSRADVAVAEQELRDTTLLAFYQTGDKALVEGVGVKIFQKFLYDREVAKDWCLEHRIALKLDEPVFEKLAQAEKLLFVIEEPRAQIASNLEPIA